MQMGLFSETTPDHPKISDDSVPYRIPVYRIELVRDGNAGQMAGPFSRSSEIYEMASERLSKVDREHFEVILLDARHKIIGINTVSIGSLTAAIVHPREVFKAAIAASASCVLCVHNHPSGDPKPSKEDIDLTKRLQAGGKILGIPVLDHVIIGEDRYFSFADEGLLKK
jgi:DNA repair protein RadC|tara:strand:- start:1512 stop:2018 length:507 start_codon:yes stop_codon:yes gene_type:complete